LVYAATRRTSHKSEDEYKLDEHRVYGIRQRIHDLFDVDASNFCVVAPASARLYDAELLGDV